MTKWIEVGNSKAIVHENGKEKERNKLFKKKITRIQFLSSENFPAFLLHKSHHRNGIIYFTFSKKCQCDYTNYIRSQFWWLLVQSLSFWTGEGGNCTYFNPLRNNYVAEGVHWDNIHTISHPTNWVNIPIDTIIKSLQNLLSTIIIFVTVIIKISIVVCFGCGMENCQQCNHVASFREPLEGERWPRVMHSVLYTSQGTRTLSQNPQMAFLIRYWYRIAVSFYTSKVGVGKYYFYFKTFSSQSSKFIYYYNIREDEDPEKRITRRK